MKTLFKYVSSFFIEDFHPVYYSLALIFTGLVIVFNYAVNFENGYLDVLPNFITRFVAFTSFYTISWILLLLLNQTLTKQKILSKQVIGYGLFGFALLSADTAWHLYLLFRDLPTPLYYYVPRIVSNLATIFTYVLPLWIFTFITRQSGFYGISRQGFNPRPYYALFIIVVPLVTFASFLPSFHNYYPLYQYPRASTYLGIPEIVGAGIYELAYGWGFVAVELLFRGFFVIGMIKVLGRNAVLPAAITYAFIHFGKPPVETVSAVFGGYILGAIAYKTNNIWGGIIIHVGLAWLMELTAYVQNLFR